MNHKELRSFVRTMMDYLDFLEDGELNPDQMVDDAAKRYMKKWDIDKDGGLSLNEWTAFCTRDPDCLKYMFAMGFITKFEMGFD
jgi:hypothetical protein